MGSDPWALPNPVVMLLVLLAALVAVPALGGYGVAVLVRARRRERVLRGLAALAGATTVAVYAFGVLTMFQDETAADEACKRAVPPTLAGHVSGYETSFVPLRFGCHVEGAGTWDIWVPGWVNPAVAALLVVTVVTVALARRATRRPAPVANTSGSIS